MPKINCRGCKHYYITFDASAPYGCRIYGFKSKFTPSLAVYQSSGIDCTLFFKKESNNSGNIDNKKNKNSGFYA